MAPTEAPTEAPTAAPTTIAPSEEIPVPVEGCTAENTANWSYNNFADCNWVFVECQGKWQCIKRDCEWKFNQSDCSWYCEKNQTDGGEIPDGGSGGTSNETCNITCEEFQSLKDRISALE